MTGFGLLHIDPAYTLRAVRAMDHESFFLARDASGLFNEVWSVHPVADMAGAPRGTIDVYKFSRSHALIEGKAELCRLPRFLLPLNVLLSQFALYRLLVRVVRRNRIAVVVGVDPFLAGLLALAVARTTKRPFVLRISGNPDDIHGATGALAMPRLFPSYKIQRAVQRFVVKRADLVTAINRNNLEYGIANGAQSTAILPISGHIEPVHRMSPDRRRGGAQMIERLAGPSEGPMLLYFGRLIELKHPDDAVRAMADVIHRHPKSRGIVAGSGDMQSRLVSLAAELGVAESIHFPGQLDQRALSLIIPHCIVLSPSAGQMALLESALGGAAIVAYDRDFQPEFIDDGVDGFIVPFRDWRAMAARAAEIARNPDLHRRLSSRVREKALHYMDPQRIKSAEWAAFAKILDISEPGAVPPQP